MAVLADLAEWERDVLIARTHEGLAQARKMRRTGGRPAALDAQQRANVITCDSSGIARANLRARLPVAGGRRTDAAQR